MKNTCGEFLTNQCLIVTTDSKVLMLLVIGFVAGSVLTALAIRFSMRVS